jgi:hypothetical protein
VSKRIDPRHLGDAITKELELYQENVTERVNTAGEQAVKKLAKITRSTAPVITGSYAKNISSKLLRPLPSGNVYVWYVKPPDHRLTHLLVHGHPTKNGGRTWENPFLQNALYTVLPEYEEAVKEAVKA